MIVQKTATGQLGRRGCQQDRPARAAGAGGCCRRPSCLLHLLQPRGVDAVLRRYRIPELRRVRDEFAAQVGTQRGPLLVCANHLTLIDSLVIQWALAPGWRLSCGRTGSPGTCPTSTTSRSTCWSGPRLFRQVRPGAAEGPPEEVAADARQGDVAAGARPVGAGLSRGRAQPRRARGHGELHVRRRPDAAGDARSARPVRVRCAAAGSEAYSNYPRRGETFVVRMQRIAPTTTFAGHAGGPRSGDADRAAN